MMNGVASGSTRSGSLAVLPSGVVISDPDDRDDEHGERADQELAAAERADEAVSVGAGA